MILEIGARAKIKEQDFDVINPLMSRKLGYVDSIILIFGTIDRCDSTLKILMVSRLCDIGTMLAIAAFRLFHGSAEMKTVQICSQLSG